MKNLFLILFSFLCASCQNNNATSIDTSNQSSSRANVVCYSSSACYSLIPIESDKYGYKDPSKNQMNPIQYRKPVRAIPIKDQNVNQKLSTNFKFIDFMSPEKDEIGIFSPSVLNHVEELQSLLTKKLKINSGYRTPRYNAGVPGSASWSRHSYGDGVDLDSDEISVPQLRDLCLKLKASFTQLYTKHVHCDWRSESLNEEFYGASSHKSLDPEVIHRRTVDVLTENSSIEISGEIKSGSTIVLSSITIDPEDQEEERNSQILKEWIITTPSRKVINTNRDQIVLPLKSGLYKIQHLIGGNIYLEKLIQVP